MNLKKGIWVVLTALVLGPAVVMAGGKDMEMPKPQTSPEFEKMKSLVGTWTGKAKMHGDSEKDMEVIYKLTAGGSAVVETICPGTPNEMTTVYHLKDGKLCMTHYCTLGNCPQMKLKKSTDNELSFEMEGKDGIGSSKEMHMHALDITWKDADHITAAWALYNGGKAAPCEPFVLTRKK